MLVIRLRRGGRKGLPHYRIVVAQKTYAANGKFIQILGFYNPLTKELKLNKELAIDWLNKGCQPSNAVAKLMLRLDMKHKLIVFKEFHAKPKGKDKEAQPSVKKPEAPTTEKSEPETPSTPQEESAPEEKSKKPEPEKVSAPEIAENKKSTPQKPEEKTIPTPRQGEGTESRPEPVSPSQGGSVGKQTPNNKEKEISTEEKK